MESLAVIYIGGGVVTLIIILIILFLLFGRVSPPRSPVASRAAPPGIQFSPTVVLRGWSIADGGALRPAVSVADAGAQPARAVREKLHEEAASSDPRCFGVT